MRLEACGQWVCTEHAGNPSDPSLREGPPPRPGRGNVLQALGFAPAPGFRPSTSLRATSSRGGGKCAPALRNTPRSRRVTTAPRTGAVADLTGGFPIISGGGGQGRLLLSSGPATTETGCTGHTGNPSDPPLRLRATSPPGRGNALQALGFAPRSRTARQTGVPVMNVGWRRGPGPCIGSRQPTTDNQQHSTPASPPSTFLPTAP